MNKNTVLINLKGEQLTKKEFMCPECQHSYGQKSDVTFGDIALAALFNAPANPKQKVERFKLCQKIENSNGKLAFSADEVSMLKECVEIDSPILLAGRMMEILDPNG